MRDLFAKIPQRMLVIAQKITKVKEFRGLQ
ncbi:hypothetical protein SMB34_17160 [Thalassospira permensis NBRC 106175]|jgi:hypothetical protein|uniref:Uncharacterized protein n=1 Tax=Thalassospira permensis NBRC 106175 TaxID=1353532 RepID=A0ABR4TNZ3_9PROT|nr:hypothetical protein SMB34_17160 [Thalassospira permensis NBRC 106175]